MSFSSYARNCMYIRVLRRRSVKLQSQSFLSDDSRCCCKEVPRLPVLGRTFTKKVVYCVKLFFHDFIAKRIDPRDRCMSTRNINRTANGAATELDLKET